jgi:leucyl/phenylalanyl-tRNA--protein transferase
MTGHAPPLPWIADDHTPLPPTRLALGPRTSAPGLLAAGGALTLRRLDEAYRRGIFPWYSDGQPVLWWAPDPRMVLHCAEFRLPRSLRKTIVRLLRTPGDTIRIDSACRAVIEACARAPRAGQAGTWILPEMVDAYAAWHDAGAVHSVETWIDGELAGGLYGVAIGRMFYGESMFARRSDASKVALAALVAHCRAAGITLIDCQQNTEHLAGFGAREIGRSAFERHLARATAQTPAVDWTYDPAHWAQLGLRSETDAT